MPADTKQAIIIFFFPNFNLSSRTLEQKTATNTTEITLHDSNMTTIGKLVIIIATIERTDVNAIANPQTKLFFLGIYVFSSIK